MARYAVVGRGRWGTRMAALLESMEQRVVAMSAPRRAAGEPDDEFVARASGSFRAAGVDAAWLCVPPGAHVPRLADAALDAGLHVIVEKPWDYDTPAARPGVVAAVDFEYCFLDGVRRWRDEGIGAGDGLGFGGRFVVPGENRLGIPALDNLGSHLVAIRSFAAPAARLDGIDCAYGGAADRRVWLDRAGTRVAEVDFTDNDEPILQRFVRAFEAAWSGGSFALDLEFGAGVADAVRALA